VFFEAFDGVLLPRYWMLKNINLVDYIFWSLISYTSSFIILTQPKNESFD